MTNLDSLGLHCLLTIPHWTGCQGPHSCKLSRPCADLLFEASESEENVVRLSFIHVEAYTDCVQLFVLLQFDLVAFAYQEGLDVSVVGVED